MLEFRQFNAEKTYVNCPTANILNYTIFADRREYNVVDSNVIWGCFTKGNIKKDGTIIFDVPNWTSSSQTFIDEGNWYKITFIYRAAASYSEYECLWILTAYKLEAKPEIFSIYFDLKDKYNVGDDGKFKLVINNNTQITFSNCLITLKYRVYTPFGFLEGKIDRTENIVPGTNEFIYTLDTSKPTATIELIPQILIRVTPSSLNLSSCVYVSIGGTLKIPKSDELLDFETVVGSSAYTSVIEPIPPSMKITSVEQYVYRNGQTVPSTSANAGEGLYIIAKTVNEGGGGDVFIKLIDADTGTVIKEAEGGPFYMNSGEQYDAEFEITMPNKTYNLRIEAGHNTTIDDYKTITYTLLTPPTPPIAAAVPLYLLPVIGVGALAAYYFYKKRKII